MMGRGLGLASALLVSACGADAAPGEEPSEDAVVAPVAEVGGVHTDVGVTSDTGVDDTFVPPTCDVRTFGAKGDGKTKDTKAIQAAVDACAGTGGTVLLSGGTFSSGMIRLASRLSFVIAKGATLRGTQDDADYPDLHPASDNTQLHNCRKALLYAEGAIDLHIGGAGTLDGNGDTPKWIGPSKVHPEATRPMAIFTVGAKNLVIEGLRVVDAAMWGVVTMEAEGLHIHDLTIDSPLSGNRDGIDVVDCHHVLVEDVTITSEDDSICLKSGTARGVDDVLVRRAHVQRSIVANALKMGTASYGGFSNVTFEDVTIDHADKAAMAVESVDGGAISNIVFRRIRFADVGSPMFVLLGDRGETPLGSVHRVGSIKGVRFEDVVGTSTRYGWGSPISGTRTSDGVVHAIEGLSFVDVKLATKGGSNVVPADPGEYHGQYPDPNLWGDLPAYAWFIRHASSVTFERSTATAGSKDARKALETRDVTGLVVK